MLADGVGHGSYRPAAVLFPYTMLSARLYGVIRPPFAVLALAQFPLYGLFIGWTGTRGIYAVAIVHAIAAATVILWRGSAF